MLLGLHGLSPTPLPAAEPFPLAATVEATRPRLAATAVTPTGLTREEYLEVIRGIVNHFRHFQTNDGRLLDPFVHREVQYSTPCFAWAATALVVSGRQPDLLEPASRALEAALRQLAEGTAADGHGDFFTFPAMLAYEHLRERVDQAPRHRWEQLLRALEPARAYRDVPGRREVHNWNIVALAGEFLRHQAGFTDLAFVETSLARQRQYFTPTGQYRDPNGPLAYDHFPRHFLAAMLERGYAGEHAAALAEWLGRAAWTSLLIQSPRGELPTGGRSAQHQWNEAQQCVTYELWAAHCQREGDPTAARAGKRAARLALESIRRWTRPSGELWIVKNRFDPALRHGFEGYSFHSQYNLLAASMLATAWLCADDTIPEGAAPADVGGFVVELPEFHKVIANAGGFYLEIDTAADPKYNSTGLIRLHRRGVDSLVGPTDSSPIAVAPLAVGVAWPEDDHWQPLAGLGQGHIHATHLTLLHTEPEEVRFSVRYDLDRPHLRSLTELYELTPNLLRLTTTVDGAVDRLRVRYPALAFDGERAARITTDGAVAVVRLGQSQSRFVVESPANVTLRRAGEWIASRNGFLEAIEGDVPGRRVVCTLHLSPVPLD